MTASEKVDLRASVRANREQAPGFWRMSLHAPALARRFRPGQFFQLRIHPDSGLPLLRRPFAPSEVTKTGFAFVYAVVGDGTEAMTRLTKGADVQVLGPLGTAWPLPRVGSRAVLVGGGCGTPSLRCLGEVLADRGVKVAVVLGAQTACTLLEKAAFKRIATTVAVSTDDGSEGFHGHAVDATRALLDELGPRPKPTLYGCGPQVMLAGLAALAAQRDLRCYVSLEERMACGFGACMGCAVPIQADTPEGYVYQRVCTEGPVFDAQEVVWDAV